VSTTQELTTEIESELKSEAMTVIERSALIKITDQSSYEEACSILINQIKPLRKRWSDFWEGMREPAYRAYQAIMDKKTAGDKPLEMAERQIKSEVARWETEQSRIREDAQRKAQAEAEEAARIEQVKNAEFAGMAGASKQEVEAIASAPVVVVAAPVEASYEKVSGVSIRSKWVAVVQDAKKLCAAIGKGLVPVNYVTPNQAALNARASADKSTLNIPGVVAREEKIVAGRSKF
jgi:hypothetical protein